MQSLMAFPDDDRRAVRGVLLDIDDTLTTDGRLTAKACRVGGPAERWGTGCTGNGPARGGAITPLWPDAIVEENGAFYFRYDHDERRMTRRYYADSDAIAANRTNWMPSADRGGRTGASIAADQATGADLPSISARTYPLGPRCHRPHRLANDQCRHDGQGQLHHVNGWFGEYDKLTMIRHLFDEIFHVDLDAERARFVFVGDSPNDQPAFAYFPNAVGVANVQDFADQLMSPPPS